MKNFLEYAHGAVHITVSEVHLTSVCLPVNCKRSSLCFCLVPRTTRRRGWELLGVALTAEHMIGWDCLCVCVCTLTYTSECGLDTQACSHPMLWVCKNKCLLPHHPPAPVFSADSTPPSSPVGLGKWWYADKRSPFSNKVYLDPSPAQRPNCHLTLEKLHEPLWATAKCENTSPT